MTSRDLAGQDRRTLLGEVAEVWEAQARADPLWAVLSEPDRRGRRWDLDSFLATGEDHVARALERFESLGGSLVDRDLAVDFGSGVGRLSQPLGDRFSRVVGIDISPTMAAVARKLNRHAGRVEYRVNDEPDLSFIDDRSVSLVFSHITLQHLPPQAARAYLGEFLRIVKTGGGVIFQLPSHYSDDYLPAERDDLPVPAGDRTAAVEIVECPERIKAGSRAEVVVDVTNRSVAEWVQSSTNVLNVGNHWRQLDGPRTFLHDDGRSRLPGRLAPGSSCRVTVPISAPAQPGLYRIEAQVVQEGVAWFDLGADAIAELPLWVTSAGGESASEGSSADRYADDILMDAVAPVYFEAPQFEMNAIPKNEVEDLIRASGAVVLGTDEWVTEWHSYTYFVQMPSLF